jgi:DNA primase
MTVDEMEKVLDSLDIEHVGTRGDEIQGFCPAHEERTGHVDHSPSWYINSDTGAHICFSCDFRGNVVTLVAKLKGYDTFEEAKEWLSGGSNGFLEAIERSLEKREVHPFEELVYVSEASLAAFKYPPDKALKSRGLTLEAANKHQVLWNKRQQAWVTPIRDAATNQLLGWQEKGYYGRYFENNPAGTKKSNALFGLNQYDGGTMIVVESPLDVVRLESLGITGGVSTFGAIISPKQLEYIRKADRVLFALDSDAAGLAASMKMLDLTKEFNFEAWFFNYDNIDIKDVGGMSRAEVLQGIENAIHSVRYGLNI